MIAVATYVFIAVILVVAIYRAPVIAIAPVLCMFGLEQWAQAMSPFFTRFNTVTNLLVGALVVFGLTLMFLRGRDISLSYSAAGWLVLLLFFYAFTSLLWAPNPDMVMHLWSSRLPYIMITLVLAPLLINSVSDAQKMCWSVLLLGAPLVIMVLIFVDWEGRGIVLAGGAETATGATGNPLALSQMAGYVAFAAIFLSGLKAAPLYRVLRWLLVAVCLMVVVKSGSRGQFFGILFIAAFFLVFSLPSKGMRGAFWGTVGLGALFILAGWALANFAETDRWDSDEMEAASAGRWDSASALLGHWYTSPGVFFFGLGNSAAFDLIGYYPHVTALEIVAEEGVVGFVLFLAIIYLATRGLIRGYKTIKHDEANRGALLTLGCWFCFELFLSFKQGSMLGGLLLFLFAINLSKYEKMAAIRERQEATASRIRQT